MRHLAPAETKRRREIIRKGLRKLLEASTNGDPYQRGVAFADMFHDPTHHKPPYAKRTMDTLVEAGVVIFSRKRYQIADGRRDELREVINEDAKLDSLFMSGAELRAKLMEEGVTLDTFLEGDDGEEYEEEGTIEVVEDSDDDSSEQAVVDTVDKLLRENGVNVYDTTNPFADPPARSPVRSPVEDESSEPGDPAADFVLRFVEMEKQVATMAAQINEIHQALMGTNTKAGTGG